MEFKLTLKDPFELFSMLVMLMTIGTASASGGEGLNVQ